VAEITHTAGMGGASAREAADSHARSDDASPHGNALAPLTAVDAGQWRELAGRAVEPNGYYLPEWEMAVNAFAPGRAGASMLAAWRDASCCRLIGLMPVVSLWRAYRIPLPALVSAHPYGTLCTPPLDRDFAEDAVTQLIRQARRAGARALMLRDMSLDGPAMKAFSDALRRGGLHPRVLQSGLRACLDATRDGDQLLHDALGARKLRELRRQRSRLADHGAVDFEVARSADEVTAALEVFLKLEASGWKGERGTALIQHDGDASFIRRAAPALAANGQCEIVTLRAGDTPVAAAIVLRHRHRAFYFKLGIDERYAKFSPGVQLTLDLTRHLCADPAITSADSTASPDHPMINPIWRGRLAIGDVLIPLRPNDPVASLIHAAMILRHAALELARRGVRLIRARRRRR
jgi:CelD/BcsL family acetyltransferase involved in cellulose biosynthesis